jgi:putative membrane protein
MSAPEETKPDYAARRPEWIEGMSGEGSQTELSKHRTHLSEHRTDLSEHRTGLSELRSHLSNERTHLSYLRTAVSLIGFGITLNRFSIYLRQEKGLAAAGSRLLLRNTGNVGSGMVILGLALLVWSLYRYWQTSKEIETGSCQPRYRAVSVMTLALIILGGASAVWLFTL